ncbi:hypothetical protein GS531_00695 [Rhodococcus hoagii]|nr:hypothetical protein [Prescottella equi]
MKLSAAMIRARQAEPYLATALRAMTLIPAPGTGTFAIDKWWRCYLDPQCVDTWAVEVIATALRHEVRHVMYRHASRAEVLGVARDDERDDWNKAADAPINASVEAAGHAWWPFPVIHARSIPGGVAGMVSEELYALLRADHVAVQEDPQSGLETVRAKAVRVARETISLPGQARPQAAMVRAATRTRTMRARAVAADQGPVPRARTNSRTREPADLLVSTTRSPTSSSDARPRTLRNTGRSTQDPCPATSICGPTPSSPRSTTGDGNWRQRSGPPSDGPPAPTTTATVGGPLARPPGPASSCREW